MGKAILAMAVTFIVGMISMVIGFEFLGGIPEFGIVVAVVVMGGFNIYFHEKRH